MESCIGLSEESLNRINLNFRIIDNNKIISGLKLGMKLNDWKVVEMVIDELKSEQANLRKELEKL
jgi:hypothetical protein